MAHPDMAAGIGCLLYGGLHLLFPRFWAQFYWFAGNAQRRLQLARLSGVYGLGLGVVFLGAWLWSR